MTKLAMKYSTVVRFYAEDTGFIATAEEFPGLSAYGASRDEAVREFEVVLELAVQEYVESGWPLPLPATMPSPEANLPSGEFRVRLPRSVHAELARQARLDGVSQNTLVVSYVSRGLEAAQRSLGPAAREERTLLESAADAAST